MALPLEALDCDAISLDRPLSIANALTLLLASALFNAFLEASCFGPAGALRGAGLPVALRSPGGVATDIVGVAGRMGCIGMIWPVP